MQGFPPPENKRFNSTNWAIYPYNRWGLQNIPRFFPIAVLDNGPGKSVPWEFEPQYLDSLKYKTTNQKEFTVRQVMKVYNTDALLVVHNGKIVYERYWNGMTPTSPHWMASTSKSLAGTAAATLIERGALDRNKPVKDYVPELAKSGFGNATIDQLLDMTVGTAWDESPEKPANPKSFARQYAYGRRVFPATVVKDILENGDAEIFARGARADVYPGGAYRNYWWVKNDADKAYVGTGIFGQYIYINPAKRVVIIRFASEKTSRDLVRIQNLEPAFQAIADYLGKNTQ